MRGQLNKQRGMVDMRTNYTVRFLVIALFLLAASGASLAQVSIGISVGFAPPPLPVYEQPICPAEGYLWTPGYWAWDDEDGDYYWVPGTWVQAPEVGYLWTPSYWGWGGNAFIFHEGYWGPQVGFYGGINYGYGYFGHGYEGGRWDRDRFYYNRTVNNINVTEIHNTYNTTIVNNNRTVNRISYNGGNGGVNERPTRQEEGAARERHLPPVAPQVQHVQAARTNRDLRASVNQGKPPIAATPRPAAFNERGTVPARQAGGRYEPPPQSNRNANNVRGNNGGARDSRVTSGGNNVGANNANRPPVHVNELPPHQRPPAPNTGNPKVDQKYQQQQDKMYARQEQDRQRLQQKQEQDHQRLTQQRANDARTQQVEQRHQQQTQQLQQRHDQQQQHIQQRQPPPQQPRHESRPPGRPQ
jgi:hypothetical protein